MWIKCSEQLGDEDYREILVNMDQITYARCKDNTCMLFFTDGSSVAVAAQDYDKLISKAWQRRLL